MRVKSQSHSFLHELGLFLSYFGKLIQSSSPSPSSPPSSSSNRHHPVEQLRHTALSLQLPITQLYAPLWTILEFHQTRPSYRQHDGSAAPHRLAQSLSQLQGATALYSLWLRVCFHLLSVTQVSQESQMSELLESPEDVSPLVRWNSLSLLVGI